MTDSNSDRQHLSGPRIRQEKRTIDAMLGLYCRDLHGTRAGLCASCGQLRDYAHRRLDTCPFQEEKPVCNRCEVHCYSRTMRAKVQEVMRYAGPRMPLRHPWLALLHLVDKLRVVPSLVRRSRARPQSAGKSDRARSGPKGRASV